MKKLALLMLSTMIALFVFISCDPATGSSKNSTIATELTLTAVDGTDFGTLSLGESTTKKFTVTLNGYAEYKLVLSMPAGFESPDFDTNAQYSFDKKTKSFDFTAVYSPVFDGSDDNNTIAVTKIGFDGYSDEIEVTASGKNTGLKNPADKTAKTIVTIIDKPETVTLSDRDETTSPYATYIVAAEESTPCQIKVRFESDKYESSVSSGTMTGNCFTWEYTSLSFPNKANENYVEITINYDGKACVNTKNEHYTSKNSPFRLNFGDAKVIFISQE